MSTRKVIAIDCETDPFKHERVPIPFLWGAYNGKKFRHWFDTAEFVAWLMQQNVIAYAHNGGKFDFMYLLEYIKQTKAQIINGRIVSMMLGRAELRDSFATVPVSMKEIQKEDIEMWKLERHCREQYMEEILFRNRTDCEYLYALMTKYREIAGTQKTIASNALRFAQKLGLDIGCTNHSFDREFREFFFGGRCECFQPGTFHNVKIIDIRSAYPYAMTHNHPTGTAVSVGGIEKLTTEEIQRSFIRIECHSAGAFPIRIKTGLSFPHEYNEFHVSGWEYLAALELGLLSDITHVSAFTFEKTINFSPYINHWYAYKAAHNKKTNPIEYTIGKYMQNALYGKTAQNPANYYDYKFVPACTPIDELHGWEQYTENDKFEIHRRESLWKYKHKIDKQTGKVEETGNDWQRSRIYKNVATGASITGFTRAHLLRAIHAIGLKHVLYSDTDSIIAKSTADLSRVPLSDALGDWELEDGCAPILHVAGKKLYAARLSSGKDKVACKGSRLSFNDLGMIVNGEKIIWRNPAPTFSIDGTAKFLHRDVTATHPALRKLRERT